MERIKHYREVKKEGKQNSKNKEELKEEKNISHTKKYYNHKRKYKNKEKNSNKKIKNSQNSKDKTKNRRTYTKRTDLIQERLKILQLAKKNIDIEDPEQNNNKKEEISPFMLLTEYQKGKKELKNINLEKDNLLINSLKIEEMNKNNLDKINIIENNRYVKKIPTKRVGNTEEPLIIKKYQTSTFIYKKDPNSNKIINKNYEKYNVYTYNKEKEIKNDYKEIKTNDINDMDLIGYKTGFVYQNKIMKSKIDSRESSGQNSPKINSFLFVKAKSKRNNHKNNYNNNLLINSESNIKEVKDDYDSDKDIFNNKEKVILNTIYIPKKVRHHLNRGTSQENVNNLNKHNFVSSNVTLKNRYKSYKRIDNNFSKKNNKSNINININNNIKIITYNKKKPFWKLDKKNENDFENENENDNDNIELIEKKLDEDKFDIFKDNISDISSIESKSYVESETTENNNKLNVYLNNIYKTKSIFHPKLYKRKDDNTVKDKEPTNMKYSLNTFKNNINNTNEKKGSRNISVPHFIFKKRITKDISEHNLQSSLKKNKLIKNNIKNFKIINNIGNEPKFYELVILLEELKKIIDGIDKNSPIISNLCFDFLNNFNESSFLNLIEKLFENKNLKIIQKYLKYLIYSNIILYDYCLDSLIEENDKFLIQEIFSLNFQNILHLYEYIISKVKSKNPWANIIKNIIHNYKKQKNNFFSSSTNNYQSIFDKIKNNIKYIRQIINRVFSNNIKISDKIIPFCKELENKTFLEIKNFYVKNIYHQNEMYGYIYPSSLYNNIKNDFLQVKLSFIKKDKNKKYTLFLGLEDILLNFKLKNEYDTKGKIRLRPGLIQFLTEIQKYYEIIVFSLCDNKIVDYLINSLDKRKIFFDYRLYRENFNIFNDEFVLNLNHFSRDLDKIVIISNIPQIYKLHKENSINVKSYWEEDFDDNILIKLIPILKNIVEEEADVPEMLLKYKDEIIKNVTIGSFKY